MRRFGGWPCPGTFGDATGAVRGPEPAGPAFGPFPLGRTLAAEVPAEAGAARAAASMSKYLEMVSFNESQRLSKCKTGRFELVILKHGLQYEHINHV